MAMLLRSSRNILPFIPCGRRTGVLSRNLNGVGSYKTPLPFSAMPGPQPLPLVGNSMELKKNLANLRLYFEEGFKKYGDIYRIKGVGDTVLVKDPSVIEAVLRGEGKYPARDTVFSPNIAWLYENKVKIRPILSFRSGESWRKLRSAMGKQIMLQNVQIWHDSYNDIIHRFIGYIRSSRDADGNIKDIHYPINRLVIEIAAKTTFDSEWDVVANPTMKEKEFMSAVHFLMAAPLRASVELPLYKLYDNKFSRDFKAAFKALKDRCKSEVERISTLIESGKESSKPGLFEQWLREGKMSKEEAVIEAIEAFSGGVDTTGSQATFLLHAIARNEDVQERLYDEIRSVLGTCKLPQPEHLAKMPFMKGCLQESYRLYSTTPTIPRVLTKDAVLHGYKVPANTSVHYCTYAAGRDESLFPNPLKFDPERWERDNTKAFAIQPFGFGPRACYGRRFAELEMKLFLIQMVYNFKMSAPKEIELIERSILCPNGDVTIQFTDRNPSK